MRLLIVGNLDGYMSDAAKIARVKGAHVSHVADPKGAIDSIRLGKSADLIFLDIAFDTGVFMDQLSSERIQIPVIACGINADSTQAAASIKGGAQDYLPLPPNPELIAAILETVTHDDHAIVCQDPKMLAVLELAKKVAPSNASVLLTGESGTGKEVVAHYIHAHSPRASKSFISVNCAAIPENLLESELFGHEKGSFTGAVARRIGKFEEASGGTLLLDEISEMHPRLQAKLLRAIQEREIDRVGGNKPVPIDIRLLATSNRDLTAEVKNGNFREDLYFRLNVVNLRLPSLAERPQDVLALAHHFLGKYAAANGVGLKRFSRDAETALQNHPWPGNVRELENAMHRAVLLSVGPEITPDDIFLQGLTQTEKSAGHNPALVGRTMSDVERELILATLDHCLGNRTHAAHILGISIRTLRNKLSAYMTEGEPALSEEASGHTAKQRAYYK